MDRNLHPSTEPVDTLAAEFFGSGAASGGPFSLLGLPHAIDDDHQIARALQRRVGQLERHPHRATPRADEARLALHAAAAQLLDASLRPALAERWPPGETTSVPQAWRRTLRAVSPEVARSARYMIAACGGWNEQAKKRLAYLARRHRVSAMDLIRTIGPAPNTDQGQRGERAQRSWSLRIPEPAGSGGYWLLVHGTLAAMLLTIGVLITIELGQAPETASVAPTPTARADTPADTQNQIPGPRARIAHHAALEQELRNTGLVAIDRPGDAVPRVARAIEVFIAGWTQYPPEARQRFIDVLTPIVSRVARAPVDDTPWIDALRAAIASGEPARVACAQSLAATLSADASIPPHAAVAFGKLSPTSDRLSFDAHLLRLLTLQVDQAVPSDLNWWTMWSEGIEAVRAESDVAADNAVLHAIEHVLRTGADTDRARPVVSLLAGEVVWRPSGPARRWLLDALVDPAFSAPAITLLTEVLATDVSAPGIDLTMVLDPASDLQGRRRLAGEIRSVWLSQREQLTPLQSELLERLRAAADSVGVDDAYRDRFSHAALLARLNACAALDFAGDHEAASTFLLDPPESTGVRGLSMQGERLGSDWSIRLMSTDDPDEQIRLLREAGGQPLWSHSAEALVHAAFRGADRSVRDRARDMLVARRASPEVLLALEREIGDNPRSALLDVLSQILPGAIDQTDEDDANAVRSRLLALAAEYATEVPWQTRVAEEHLAEALSERFGSSRALEPEHALRELVEWWRARNGLGRSDALGADRSLALLAAMHAASTSHGQRWAAFHRAAVTLMAGSLVERSDIPRSSVERIIRLMDFEWRSARTSADQMLATQRAEASLWTLFLEGTP